MSFGRFRAKKKVLLDEFGEPIAKEEKKSKMNARKIEIDGIKFSSISEGRVYEMLRDDPLIEIIEMQPKYLLQDKYTTKDGRNIRAMQYISDFRILIGLTEYVLEWKGMETEVFKIKRKIFEKLYPDENLIVIHNKKEWREFLEKSEYGK